ncbi:COG4705 family protein [Luteibacter sp. UNCMF366Tsu5.1]|uniref:COG4705 family protein n=1 Tax=Luteibacter sp. UNCMF366Tsu5.1 TaxID=1502758 RepID=UPI000908944A|nr:hypothetical protein [Luteibacter sp. UNCMF366Tsu5.1]SFW27164.1 Uncharacterized membrane-anchored protein [Luteibacter sp. UNCMF366Tsu5.1]
MQVSRPPGAGKVPQITALFWVLKVAATTLGETGGDAVSMSLGWGYAWGCAFFGAMCLVALVAQISAQAFNPWRYWFAIVATTTVGTTLADMVDRSLGLGYLGGSLSLLSLLVLTMVLWQRSTGKISVERVASPRAEIFYWTTIMLSQTLGTALGDWTSDDGGLGYFGSAMLFGGALALVAVLYAITSISRTALFWSAFVLTRPLGAAFGDFLDKPIDDGGLAVSRYTATAVLLVVMAACLTLFPQRAVRTHG